MAATKSTGAMPTLKVMSSKSAFFYHSQAEIVSLGVKQHYGKGSRQTKASSSE